MKRDGVRAVEAIPRYFFHTEDGQRVDDKDGTELPDLEAAKRSAQRLTAETLIEDGAFWAHGTFRVVVRDAPAGRSFPSR